jgi:class 3 adenylate cyclase/tetratricopeptide (TPR) repeat protein
MATGSVTCGDCGAVLAADAKFCSECGHARQQSCPSCGSPATGRFCSQCGTSLPGAATPARSASAPGTANQSVSERRVTSVLFADLVGFTPLSEDRDSEDVREILSRYFDMARVVINRYGGTIEKFIGDAVMAVWGVPIAREDDAERAVRAGLELIDSTIALREQVSVTELSMRVGIVTGEVAVTIGATGQGMVAGDPVNTASRIQALAAPNQVWVDPETRALTSAAVAYTDEGEHVLKGKVERMRLFAARRVVASVGGAQRVDGLEAPFTGRDREMRLVKELFHAVLEEARPRLVSITGLAGVGKSRLGWEFFKHLDGINDLVRWHRGRCLPYGEGVAFWALTEMVRSRLDVLEGDEPAIMADKLARGMARWVRDADERAWIEPRLAVLLGIGATAGSAGFNREDLFSAWQLFFERLVVEDATGVVLLVEDLQWADDGLLDFIEHLLQRSNAPIFILTFARPELNERRDGWATDRRATAIHLEPLPLQAMAEIIDGLVGDLPVAMRDTLVERSEGIPLYAVETVRSLIDRDVVVPVEGRYVLATGAQPDLGRSAPTSLQTLIAARLDLLTPEQRRAVQDAAVLGLAFPRSALIAFDAGQPDVNGVDAVLDSLVRKEILTLESDPRSPERGQYRFVQAMVRTVAYDTLSRRDRKARHLLAAGQLARDPDAESFAAVIAAHYVDARSAQPDDVDAADLAAEAVAWLEIAAHRARRLGAPAQAQRHIEAALTLVGNDDQALPLSIRAADAAVSAGQPRQALEHADRAMGIATAAGRTLERGRAAVHLGGALLALGRSIEIPDRLIPVYDAIPADRAAVEVRASLAKLIGRSYWLTASDVPAAETWFDRCTRLAESAELWSELADCFSAYGGLMVTTGRPTMGLGVLRIALEVAQEHELISAELGVRNNLASFSAARNLVEARAHAEAGLALCQRLGERSNAAYLGATLAHICFTSGDWNAIVLDDFPAELLAYQGVVFYVDAVRLFRGEAAYALSAPDVTTDPQWQAVLAARRAIAAWAGGDADVAHAGLVGAVDGLHRLVEFDDDFPSLWALMMEAGCDVGGTSDTTAWLARVSEAPRGMLPTLVRALLPYFRARLARNGSNQTEVEADFAEAAAALRSFGAPLWLALALLRHGEYLISVGQGESATTLLDDAEELFGSLGATPWTVKAQHARTFAIR